MAPRGYRFQIASDVIRDGMALELISNAGVWCAEVFRCDADYTLTLNIFEGVGVLPDVVIEALLVAARESLGPFEDGTPIDDIAIRDGKQPAVGMPGSGPRNHSPERTYGS